jgi:hypothetical protein
MEGGQWGCRSYYKVVAFKTAFFLFESVVDGKIVFDLARYDILGSELGAFGQVGIDGGRPKAAVPFGRLKEAAFGAGRDVFEPDDGVLWGRWGWRYGNNGGHVVGFREGQHDCYFPVSVHLPINFYQRGYANK